MVSALRNGETNCICAGYVIEERGRLVGAGCSKEHTKKAKKQDDE